MPRELFGRGCRPSPDHLVASIPSFASAGQRLVPEKEWQEFDLWPDAMRIKNQTMTNACCGHAAALSIQGVRFLYGQPYVPLSAWYPYSILCQGNDQGASIAQALDVVRKYGVAPEADVPYGTIDPRRLTEQAHKNAARFRVDIGYRVTTWEEVMSAAQRRQLINLSVCADGWSQWRPDAEGVVPLSGRPADHAITVGFGAKRSSRYGWVVKLFNSWGDAWGIRGTGWISRHHIEILYNEGYVVGQVIDDPQDPTAPPPLVAA